jgi:hypothetical protein
MKYIVLLCAGLIVGTFGAMAWTDEKLKDAEREKDAFIAAADIARAKYAEKASRVKNDTIRITRWATRYDTVRAGLDSIVLSGDSSAVPFPLFLDAINAADSTVAACRDLVHSCAELRLAAESALGATGRERDAFKKLYVSVKPSRWDRAKPYMVGGVAFWLGTKFQR